MTKPQVGVPSAGRVFQGERKVRLGDVTPGGRLRLDSLVRYTQDVSDDDTTDAGLDTELGWVVRRTRVDVVGSAVLAETMAFITFCSGLGRRWAERRLSVVGDRGCRYEVATLWICVDRETGRPRKLSERFLAIYGEAAAGRKVDARLAHPKPPDDATMMRWPLRVADFDLFGHVNNAAYWTVVEEVLAKDGSAEPSLTGPIGVGVEYSAGVPLGSEVSIAETVIDGARLLWWIAGESAPAASARIAPLPAGPYPT